MSTPGHGAGKTSATRRWTGWLAHVIDASSQQRLLLLHGHRHAKTVDAGAARAAMADARPPRRRGLRIWEDARIIRRRDFDGWVPVRVRYHFPLANRHFAHIEPKGEVKWTLPARDSQLTTDRRRIDVVQFQPVVLADAPQCRRSPRSAPRRSPGNTHGLHARRRGTASRTASARRPIAVPDRERSPSGPLSAGAVLIHPRSARKKQVRGRHAESWCAHNRRCARTPGFHSRCQRLRNPCDDPAGRRPRPLWTPHPATARCEDFCLLCLLLQPKLPITLRFQRPGLWLLPVDPVYRTLPSLLRVSENFTFRLPTRRVRGVNVRSEKNQARIRPSPITDNHYGE